MIRFRNSVALVVAVLVGSALLGAPTQARAGFELKVNLGSGDHIITDGSAQDSNTAANAITAVIIENGFSTTVNTAITNTPGDSTGALLDITYTIISIGGAGGTATITASATGYNQPPQALNPLTLTSHIGGTGTGSFTVTGQQWVDTTDQLYGMQFSPGAHGPFTTSPYSDSKTVAFNRGAGPFSLTDQLTITLGANSSTTGDLQSTVPVPAPAGLLLALSGLPVLGVGGWLRRRRMKA